MYYQETLREIQKSENEETINSRKRRNLYGLLYIPCCISTLTAVIGLGAYAIGSYQNPSSTNPSPSQKITLTQTQRTGMELIMCGLVGLVATTPLTIVGHVIESRRSDQSYSE